MKTNRPLLIFTSVAFIFALLLLVIPQLISGNLGFTFYWGIPFGLLFSLATILYLSETWDPELLQPVNPEDAADLRILWVVPLGVAFASITAQYLGEMITDMLAGAMFTWIIIIFAYMAIQVWRYRPR